jgi:AcrR family transcriptional regulator
VTDRVDKRDAILAAALELFAERGFHGTAVPLVADKAGVGAGTIYRYFPSKESLVNELYLREKGEIGRILLVGFPFEASAREQFHYFWSKCTTFAQEHPLSFKFLELHHHAAYLGDECRRLENQVLEPAFQFFLTTANAKITKPLPAPLLGSIVWGAFVGMIKAAWEGRIDLTVANIEAAEQCCWEAIRA